MLTRGDISFLEAFRVYYIVLVICFLSLSLNSALYVRRMNDICNQRKASFEQIAAVFKTIVKGNFLFR